MERDTTAAGSQASAPVSEVDEFMQAIGGTPDQEQPQEFVQDQTFAAATDEAGSPDAQGSFPEGSETDEAPDQQGGDQLPAGTSAAAPDQTQTQIDYAAELKKANEAREAAQAAADANAARIKQWEAAQATAMQQQRMMQAEQQRQERINQAYAIHQQMIDAGNIQGANAYIRNFNDQLMVADRQAAAAQIANTKVQMEQELQRVVQPQYAQHVVQTYELPAEYTQILAQYDGYTQDRLAPQLKAQHLAYQQKESERIRQQDQRIRELEAAMKVGGGAFAPGGNGGSAGAPRGNRPTDPREAEVFDYLDAPPLQR